MVGFLTKANGTTSSIISRDILEAAIVLHVCGQSDQPFVSFTIYAK